MSETTEITELLAQHPRLIGALATLFLLVSQAGTTLAACGYSIAGP